MGYNVASLLRHPLELVPRGPIDNLFARPRRISRARRKSGPTCSSGATCGVSSGNWLRIPSTLKIQSAWWSTRTWSCYLYQRTW